MQQIKVDGRRLIAFPNINNYNIAIRYLCEQGLGASYLSMPPSTKETVELGSRYSPDYVCAPYKHTLGSLIEAANAGADTIIEVGGLCRLDYYGQPQKKVLSELGYDCEFIDLAFYMQAKKKKEWLKLAKHLSTNFNAAKAMTTLLEAVKMVEYLDEVEAYVNKNACFERDPGSFKREHKRFIRGMKSAESYGEIKSTYLSAMTAMEEIPLRENPDAIKIGIIGEYFTIMDPHSNLHIEDKLIAQNCSVSRFLNITNCHIKTRETSLRPKIKEYASFNMGATNTWTINAALDYAGRGYDGIVHVKSFGCTPETDAIPVLQNISADYRVPMLFLSYDTQTSDTGLDTRIEAFCDMLKRKKKVLH